MHTYTSEQRERKRLYDIAYRAKTKDKRKKQVAVYYIRNKDKIRKWLNCYQNKWRKTLRGRIAMRLSNAKRRKRARETKDGTVTRNSIEMLLKTQNNQCAICFCYLDTTKMHLDHIVPLVSGGRHIISNLQWTCSQCNLTKHKKGMLCHPENFPHLRH